MQRTVEQINGREGETATLLSRCVLNFSLRVFGFAPRHLNRSTAFFEMTSELLQAIENDDAPKVREILSTGVDVNFESDDGEFPLEIACWRGKKEIVELLIENGANVNCADEGEFRTALMMASRHGHAEIVQLLLKHGADVNAEDDYNATALTNAADFGHFEVVRLLLEHGANPNVVEERDKTAAELAEASGHFEVAELIRRSAKSNGA